MQIDFRAEHCENADSSKMVNRESDSNASGTKDLHWLKQDEEMRRT
jgi:hypothetical protein